jgi:hypothetical protein
MDQFTLNIDFTLIDILVRKFLEMGLQSEHISIITVYNKHKYEIQERLRNVKKKIFFLNYFFQ